MCVDQILRAQGEGGVALGLAGAHVIDAVGLVGIVLVAARIDARHGQRFRADDQTLDQFVIDVELELMARDQRDLVAGHDVDSAFDAGGAVFVFVIGAVACAADSFRTAERRIQQ